MKDVKKVVLENRTELVQKLERVFKNIDIEASELHTDIYADCNLDSGKIEIITKKRLPDEFSSLTPDNLDHFIYKLHSGTYRPSFFRKDFTGWDASDYCEIFGISEAQLVSELVAAGVYSTTEEATAESLTGTAERWNKLFDYVCGVEKYVAMIKKYYAEKIEKSTYYSEDAERCIDELLDEL